MTGQAAYSKLHQHASTDRSVGCAGGACEPGRPLCVFAGLQGVTVSLKLALTFSTNQNRTQNQLELSGRTNTHGYVYSDFRSSNSHF